MFKRLSVIAAVFFLLTAYLNPVFAGTICDSDKAINDALTNYSSYYQSKYNFDGAPIKYVTDTSLSNLTDAAGNSYGFLTYGDPHDYKDGKPRYIGWTYYGEDYTNLDFPADKNANGANFASAGWISQPWLEPTKSAITESDRNFTKYDGDGDPSYHAQILAGIQAYGATNASNGYTIDPNDNDHQHFWDNIENYVHILAPPSSYGFGIGRMWHYVKGTLWYVTVPIAPAALVQQQQLDIQAVSIDSGVPAGTEAQPGQTYTGKAVFKALKLPASGEYHIPVNIYHQPGSNGTYYQAKINNLKLSTFGTTFSAYELVVKNQGDTVEVTFNWTCPYTGKTKLVAGVNLDYPGDTDQVSPANSKMSVTTTETDYSNNKAWVEVPVDYQNLKVEIISYPEDGAKPGDPVSVGVRVFNESGELIVTHLVAKVNGIVVKDISNFDIISQADTAISFTMTEKDASIEVIVNPDKDNPDNEINWLDNSASCTVNKVLPPSSGGGGKLNVKIYAPSKVDPFKDWNFSVKVSGYLPSPSPDESDKASISLNVIGNSKNMEYRYSGDTWGNIIITNQWPVNFNKDTSFTVRRGQNFTKTISFTFPSSSGYPGKDMSIPLKASASWRDYKGSDSTTVTIHLVPLDFSVKQKL